MTSPSVMNLDFLMRASMPWAAKNRIGIDNGKAR